MAVSYVWPITLPQFVRRDYSAAFGVPTLETPMDMGPPKTRRRGTRFGKMTVSFEMTTAQVEILRTFVESTIKGVARFGFPHPRTEQQIEVKIVPQSNGEMWTETFIGPGYWIITLNLIVLP